MLPATRLKQKPAKFRFRWLLKFTSSLTEQFSNHSLDDLKNINFIQYKRVENFE